MTNGLFRHRSPPPASLWLPAPESPCEMLFRHSAPYSYGIAGHPNPTDLGRCSRPAFSSSSESSCENHPFTMANSPPAAWQPGQWPGPAQNNVFCHHGRFGAIVKGRLICHAGSASEASVGPSLLVKDVGSSQGVSWRASPCTRSGPGWTISVLEHPKHPKRRTRLREAQTQVLLPSDFMRNPCSARPFFLPGPSQENCSSTSFDAESYRNRSRQSRLDLLRCLLLRDGEL